MISYERLFMEIEHYALKAKGAKDEQEIRELLSAIRALCDVALNSPRHAALAEHSQILTTGGNHLPSSMKIDDEDANGDSIFDF